MASSKANAIGRPPIYKAPPDGLSNAAACAAAGRPCPWRWPPGPDTAAGPAVADIIGQRKFSFDVWGTTANIASRMESLGEPGRVHVSEAVARALDGRFSFVDRGLIDVKGAGAMRTFFLGDALGSHSASS